MIEEYYNSVSADDWKKIIGEDLHYHFGNFKNTSDVKKALDNVVYDMMEYIEPSEKVLDIGCGWGGSIPLLQKKCIVKGITNSVKQYEYCLNKGFDVDLLDIEKHILPESYDVVFMLESFEHIEKKEDFIRKLPYSVNKIVIATNCLTGNKDGVWGHGNTMFIEGIDILTNYFKKNGWNVISMKNYREHTVPTISFWKENINNNYYEDMPYPIKVLDTLTKVYDYDNKLFCDSYPIYEILITKGGIHA